MKQICICIHGHFYQPPRENPWLEAVERQESANPYHDWNERILHECYLPNSKARVFANDGTIENIVSNFERISFNFGPTLMSWLEQAHPESYQRILDADRKSRSLHKGHGNAIAQVYNHMIMPLANRQDKITQVKWGVDEFRFRFGREPESIWLAETACNEETLEVVVEEGMKYLILEPHQAHFVRPLAGEWTDVSGGQIDPRQPYRYFLEKYPDKFIDIFFYDGPISKSVGFEDVLADSVHFMNRIEGAIVDSERPQLIHIATDGETYGHHKAFGDRVLAYLLFVKAPGRNYRIVNYGEFLEENPPQFEVKLKKGDSGEGTSWSCAHGVKRWKEHCGCRGGGPPEWHQHWRTPLRDSLDWLRDSLAALFEEQGSNYFKDVWAARIDYIHVILDRSVPNIHRFMKKHALRELDHDEVSFCLKLLEMQRYSMLMYTSCGWFFTEISGIETVQILQYAARAIQLALEISGKNLEHHFLGMLTEAKSNVEVYKDGRGVYEKLVKKSVANLDHIVSYYAVGSIFEDYYDTSTNRLDIYSFNLQVQYQRKESFGNTTLNLGRVKVSSKITLEEREFVFAVVQIGVYDFRCSVKAFLGQQDFEELEADIFNELHDMHIVELFKKMDRLFGEKYFALKDLLIEDRLRIITRLTKRQIGNLSKFYERVYDESRRINEIYGSINLPIPAELRYVVEHVLTKRVIEELKILSALGFPLRKASPLYRLIETAKSFNVDLQQSAIPVFFNAELNKRVKTFIGDPREEVVNECVNLHKIAQKIGVYLDLREAQDGMFFLIKKWLEDPALIPAPILSNIAQLTQLMGRLQLSVQELKKALIKSTF